MTMVIDAEGTLPEMTYNYHPQTQPVVSNSYVIVKDFYMQQPIFYSLLTTYSYVVSVMVTGGNKTLY